MKDTKAFPKSYNGTDGMTLRDYFAAQAMQGMMVEIDEPSCQYIAKQEYLMADAMLKARAT